MEDRFLISSTKERLEFKYSTYIFFKKDLYNKECIDMWIEFLSKIRNLRVYYLDKPFPPFNPEDKIKIKK